MQNLIPVHHLLLFKTLHQTVNPGLTIIIMSFAFKWQAWSCLSFAQYQYLVPLNLIHILQDSTESQVP